MFSGFEKYWTIITALFLITLITVSLFWSPYLSILAIPLLILSTGITILLIVHKQIMANHAKQIGYTALFRNIFLEVIGVLLSIGVAVFLARRSAYLISDLTIAKWENVLLTLLVAVVAGLATSRLVTVIVDWLARSRAGR